ncbi:MAG: PDZ domain-containing protein [Streptosporangiales bacterium]|nr:PDZ domain-containing protein [Streptosporangiales bacterium]
MSLIAVLGIVIFVVGILVSVALHEFGHLIPAKIFDVKVTQWMVGFGPTLWSRHRGETEYGIKLIPLGGYNRLIGMLPPRREDGGRLRAASTSPFHGVVEASRAQAMDEIRPGEEHRVFYAKPWWQKAIIMAGGPAVNLALGGVLLAVALMGFGTSMPQTTVKGVQDCVIPAAKQGAKCTAQDPVAPAAKAGLKPGDRLVSVGGVKVSDWASLTREIREAGGRTVPIVVERGGSTMTVSTDVIATRRPDLNDPEKLVKVGFIGIEPTYAVERQGPGAVMAAYGDSIVRTAGAVLRFPEKMVDVWHAAFSGRERAADSPVGIVGASRIGGEIAAAPVPLSDRISSFVGMLASVNLALGIFNLVPLLPLDGGHIAGALWEGLRRLRYKLTGRTGPTYVDVARALPLTYAMAVVIMVMGGLLIYADLVNPVRLMQ